MKVTLVEQNPNIESDGRGGIVVKTSTAIQFDGNSPAYVRGLGPLKILSGSSRIGFKLHRKLALAGAILHGAYLEDTGEIVAMISYAQGSYFSGNIPAGSELLVADIPELGALTVIKEGAVFQSGVVNIILPSKPTPKPRKRKATK